MRILTSNDRQAEPETEIDGTERDPWTSHKGELSIVNLGPAHASAIVSTPGSSHTGEVDDLFDCLISTLKKEGTHGAVDFIGKLLVLGDDSICVHSQILWSSFDETVV